MAITTYAELQTAVAAYLHRSDLTTMIPTFIALAESDFTRMQLVGQVTSTDLTVSGLTTALPADWYSTKSVTVNAGGRNQMLDEVSEEVIRSYNISGTPKHYCHSGSNILIAPTPDASYTVTLVYWKTIPALSDSNTTNFLLALSPDTYLWRSILEAAKYARDDALAQLAMSEYQRISSDLVSQDQDRAFGTSPMIRAA